MGLYLCVFTGDREVEGVEIGSYADFDFFRDAVIRVVENGRAGSLCPVLIHHSDCDGEWSVAEATVLLAELAAIEREFRRHPPTSFDSPWKTDVAKTCGIKPKNLLECFFDIDGEPLITRLRALINASIENRSAILFQ